MKPGDLKRLIKKVLSLEDADWVVAVVFVDDRAMSELNSRYRRRDGSTDVLAFSMREGEDAQYAGEVLGDIFISFETAARQARELRHSLKEEISILVVHGLLHLLGYSHRSMERRIERLKQELGGALA